MAEEGFAEEAAVRGCVRKPMKPEQLQLIAVAVGPVATLIVVFLGVLFQNRHVDPRIGDLKELLRAGMRANQSELMVKFAELDNRLSRLEGDRRIVQ
jgi:hypothetical protein